MGLIWKEAQDKVLWESKHFSGDGVEQTSWSKDDVWTGLRKRLGFGSWTWEEQWRWRNLDKPRFRSLSTCAHVGMYSFLWILPLLSPGFAWGASEMGSSVASVRETSLKQVWTLISLLLILESRIYKVLQRNGENLFMRLHQGASSKVISSSKLQDCWGSWKCSYILWV